MQLWLTREGAVPLREQLVTQIKLAIASKQLAPGAKLPSTRELARRYRVHANTVSAAYQQLEAEQWIELRHGSGVYVRTRNTEQNNDAESLVLALLANARRCGISRSGVHDALRLELARTAPERIWLVEPDLQLAAILQCEFQTAGVQVAHAAACQPDHRFILARDSQARVMAAKGHVTAIEFSSIADALKPFLPLPKELVIAVASCWSGFLDAAHTVLASAGIPEEALLMLETSQNDWGARAQSASAVICDVVTAQQLKNASSRVIGFPLLSPACLDEVKALHRWLHS